jgi:hypothetical protein
MTSINPLSETIAILRMTIEDVSLRQKHFAEGCDKWNKFCVAMDNLEDCDLAISFFLAEDLGHSEGEQYLRLYGILQAVFIQQDSITALWEIVFGEDIPNSSQESWRSVRRIRNHVAGHPIELDRDPVRKKITRRTFVNRMELKHGRLALITDENLGESEHWNFNLRDSVLDYLKETGPLLKTLYKEIQEKWFGNKC